MNIKQTQIITIPVETDIDQEQLLEIVLELAERLRDEIECYGGEATIDEQEVSVHLGEVKK